MINYVRDNGISSAQDYPYTSGSGTVGTCKNLTKIFRVAGNVNVPANSQQQMMAAVNLGVVTVAIDAGSQKF